MWQQLPGGYPGAGQPAAGALSPYPIEGNKSGSRAIAVALTVLATLVAVIAVGALVVVLADRSQEPVAQETEGTVPPGVPVLGGAPPTGLTLDDRGTSVGLTWGDPAKGKAPFIITMAKRGEQLRTVGHVNPGTEEFVEQGLNANLDYCFAVVAVYSTKQVSSSVQVCTKRGTARPQR
ncbi:hypothetical protein FHR83_005539 [Actinoplanes campanulatus]|uniref:Fibronectin type-III domain-containing protein n=1 Tax=Actinoplanes campanulatus TaxID=113559 RepID=A0A7W5FGW3_9ACTN|nr:fibronectin type III domain-containing protein [Actinoplanes campanulatus]MBB3097855.1 hypothetical protein [Actinoplanes campanulatus]